MIHKKILVTGVKGMLGSCILKEFGEANIVGFGRELDITDSSNVCKVLNKENPDIIIHTAAYTNVEEGEAEVDMSYKVNSIGTQNLVNYCVDKNVMFVYVSSTGIYGTAKEDRYTEFDQVYPTTIHHKSKYEGEKIVQNHCNKYLILRTGWLYGGEKDFPKNFVYKRFLEAQNKDVVYSDNSQIGNPTYVVDLVKQIKVLLKSEQFGVFNCINEAKDVSRFDYVKKIIELFNVNAKVEIAPEGMFRRVAKVSKNESAINYKLDLLGLNVMRNWEKSLEEYIKILKL